MAVPETTARATAAVDELYRRHVGDVYRYTYAVLGNHADAEDVTQTTFVNALRAIERGETPQEPERWLMVIAHNLVRQRWRQAAARPTVVELETDVPDSPDEEGAYELEELVRALQRIPESQREALVMRELEGRSYREIATAMGLSTSALETVLFRARRSLADELENVVTCQNAELAISKRLDGRLSRKERRRLDEHLADCPDCARLAASETRQRKAFKGLALLPLPVGLALFKGAPSAAAATSLPTIGVGATGGGTTGAGTAGAGSTAGTATGGATVGGSLAGGLGLKIAAVAATLAVTAGVGYKGVQALRDTPSTSKTAAAETQTAPKLRSSAPPAPTAPAHAAPAPKPKPHRAATPVVPHRPAVSGSEPGKPGHAATGAGADETVSAPVVAKAPVVTEAPAVAKPEHPRASKGDAQPRPRPALPPDKPVSAPKPSPPKAAAPSTTLPAGDTSGDGAPSGSDTPSSGTPPASADATSGGTTTSPAPPTGRPPGGSTGTPPVDTPPSSPPPTTPPSTPPSEQPPGDTGSGSTGGDTSGSPGDSSQGTDPWEQGQKVGHHKGNHDDKHPGDS